MFTVSADVELTGLDRAFSQESIDRIQKMLAMMVGADCQPIVPKETGTLRGTMRVTKDDVSWNTPYAEYVYNFGDVNYTTPGTSGDWFEVAANRRFDDWCEFVKDMLIREAESWG